MRISSNSAISFKSTMLTTDLDDTLLIKIGGPFIRENLCDRRYDMNVINRVEDAVQRNGIDEVLINTGRSFDEVAEVQDVLTSTSLPITGLSLDDGKMLLVKPKDLTPKQWMQTLFSKDINPLKYADKEWKAENQAPLEEIALFLIEDKGFIHRKNAAGKIIFSKMINVNDPGVKKVAGYPHWEVALVPPGINFETRIGHLSPEDEIDLEVFNDYIRKEIFQRLESAGYLLESPETKEELYYANKIQRVDINKGSCADYVRGINPQIKGEIRAGDGENDLSMLKTTTPNTQVIQMGDNPVVTDYIADSTNVTHMPTGQLGYGIEVAYKKLDVMV